MSNKQKGKVRRQRPIKGGRERVGAGVEARIEMEVERLAARFTCSKAFVIATVLADGLGIDLEARDRFDERPSHVRPLSVARRG